MVGIKFADTLAGVCRKSIRGLPEEKNSDISADPAKLQEAPYFLGRIGLISSVTGEIEYGPEERLDIKGKGSDFKNRKPVQRHCRWLSS